MVVFFFLHFVLFAVLTAFDDCQDMLDAVAANEEWMEEQIYIILVCYHIVAIIVGILAAEPQLLLNCHQFHILIYLRFD